MGDKRNYAALEWVIGEIGESLSEARKALEAYAEDTRDETRIRFCLTHIHQVLGSLKMVEFHGASLFAEEMELLAQSIISGQIVNEGEAQEVLMRSLLQLPIYLEHVKRIQDDHPGIVLPLLNDLRAARKDSYLSETNLFTPELGALSRVVGTRHPLLKNDAKLKEVLKKLFEMYQYAAASVLRGVKIEDNLAYVGKVFTRLESTSMGTVQGNLWSIACALIDSLEEDEIELSAAVKGLLRRLAKEIKKLQQQPLVAFDADIDASLARNLLYYIARSGDVSSRITAIKSRYVLDKALFEGGVEGRDFHKNMISTPEPDTIRSVVSALRDEMNSVKNILSHVATEGGAIAELESSLPIVKRVADTLAVLGVADLRHATNAQHDRLERMCKVGERDEVLLADIANELVTIEHRMEAIAKSAGKSDITTLNERDVEIDEAKITVLKECRLGLEKLKESIVEFYSSQWDRSALNGAEIIIKDIRGGLGIVPLTRASSIIEACGRFIQNEYLQTEADPSADSLTSLANAVEGVDYYLDRLIGDFSDDVDSFLELAEAALDDLGYLEPAAPKHVASGLQTAGLVAEENTLQSPSTETIATTGSDEIPQLQVGAGSVEAVAPITPEDLTESEYAIQKMASFHSVDSQNEEALEPFQLSEDVEEDLADIFVEEANEVLETLTETLPNWQGDTHKSEDLTVIRRAFHTLKGSGRMVKATDLSELAWAIENMLNRIMDQTVEPDAMHSALIDRVYALLPDLVNAFDKRFVSKNQLLAQKYASWAESFSEGTIPDELKQSEAAAIDAAIADDTAPDLQDQGDDSAISDAAENAVAGIAAIASSPTEGMQQTDDSASFAVNDAETFEKVGGFDGSGSEQAEDDASEASEEERILLDLFASEARTHLAAIDAFIADMDAAAPIYTTPTDSLQRALHTLKGSAHMAGVGAIAQMAAPLELLVKELRIYHVTVNDDVLQLIKDCSAYTREGLAYVERHEPVEVARLDQFIARVAELKEVHLGHLIRMKDVSHNVNSHPVDPRMLAIFMAEDIRLLLDADEVVQRWQADITHTSELPAMMAELKTLESGAEQANLPKMAQLSGQLHGLYEATLDHLTPDSKLFETFYAAHESLLDMIDAVAAAQTLLPPSDSLQKALDGYLIQEVSIPQPIIDLGSVGDIDVGDIEIEPTEGYSEEEDALDLSFTEQNNEHSDEQASDSSEAEATLDSAIVIEASDLFDATLTDSPEPLDVISPQDTGDLVEPEFLFDTVQDAGEAYSDQESTHEADQDLDQNSDQEIDDQQADEEAQPEQELPEPAAKVISMPENGIVFDGGDPSAIDSDDIDVEIIEIFLEEADELVEELEEAIHEWESDWQSTHAPDEMKRALHTLKGGARLSNLSVYGELTHEYETYLINHVGPDRTADFFEVVHQYQDLAHKGIHGVKAQLTGLMAPTLQSANSQPTVSEQTADQTDSITESSASKPDQYSTSEQADIRVLPSLAQTASDQFEGATEFVMPDSPGQDAQSIAAKKSSSQEVVKISSELLEELVNLAGETSISRGRLEQQVSDFGSAIGEIDITLSRLQEQLRRLDMETEAQIVFRQEQLADNEEFDPLEMDRYSQLQQLSRSLTESASDLVDLKRTLNDKVKDTEAILLQQQRINSSLQEGLMRARMVPFARMVPRLRRIVRQVATELGKQVSFELDNVDGEMDRSVLEHMVAPLEHMLRNAVDHGIEIPSERLAADKPEGGRILLTFAREGGDIILRLADDGRGIALDKVREKAIERGLMAEDADLSDHDIMQFILQAGFSTVDNVTQISGRGVGMDVVAAEIKQLGGSMTIESKANVGTQFTVRLPFTVSVNRALMVSLGKETYAIPLNTIEGIVRVSPFELEHYYNQDDAKFEYAGETYDVRYLGGMLYDDMQPRLEGQVMPLPVILVRSAQHTMALQVDALMGSREIVVKSLGSQFSSVQGLSGATVMGDGSVVVILDPHALVRHAVATIGLSAPSYTPALEQQDEIVKTVMVVDDSVTVRKVTTRFLEREGFEVITAKDGVDALQVLQGRTPDVMLLDIEMPRMDGFEVAKHMRTSEEWADIPIVMITSRTGDKHREHALSIGVNHYLGKPYQEELLLDSIRELLEE